jgi:hypothetical protein
MGFYSSPEPPQRVPVGQNRVVDFADYKNILVVGPGVFFDSRRQSLIFSDSHMVSEPSRYKVIVDKKAHILNNPQNSILVLDDAIYLGSGVDFLYYESLIYFISKLDLMQDKNLANSLNFILNENMAEQSKLFFANYLKQNFFGSQIYFASSTNVIDVRNLRIFTLETHKILENVERIVNFSRSLFTFEAVDGVGNRVMLRRKVGLHYGRSWRKPANSRILEFLSKVLGYKVIDPAEHDIQTVASIFHGADKVISYHGGGLANIIFCRPGTSVIELYSSWYDECFKGISTVSRLNYSGKFFKMREVIDIHRLIRGLIKRDKQAYKLKFWYVSLFEFLKLLRN